MTYEHGVPQTAAFSQQGERSPPLTADLNLTPPPKQSEIAFRHVTCLKTQTRLNGRRGLAHTGHRLRGAHPERAVGHQAAEAVCGGGEGGAGAGGGLFISFSGAFSSVNRRSVGVTQRLFPSVAAASDEPS